MKHLIWLVVLAAAVFTFSIAWAQDNDECSDTDCVDILVCIPCYVDIEYSDEEFDFGCLTAEELQEGTATRLYDEDDEATLFYETNVPADITAEMDEFGPEGNEWTLMWAPDIDLDEDAEFVPVDDWFLEVNAGDTIYLENEGFQITGLDPQDLAGDYETTICFTIVGEEDGEV